MSATPKTASDRGRASRAKGQVGERELCQILAEVWPEARRGLQARNGNEVPDVEGTPLWLEVKTYASHAALRHLEQAERDTDGRPAIVALRESGSPSWALLLRLQDLPRLLELVRADARFRSAVEVKRDRHKACAD